MVETFPHTFIFVKEKWFEAFHSTELGIISHCVVSQVFNYFYYITIPDTDTYLVPEDVKYLSTP